MIHWITRSILIAAVQCIVISSADSTIQPLTNDGLIFSLLCCLQRIIQMLTTLEKNQVVTSISWFAAPLKQALFSCMN